MLIVESDQGVEVWIKSKYVFLKGTFNTAPHPTSKFYPSFGATTEWTMCVAWAQKLRKFLRGCSNF